MAYDLTLEFYLPVSPDKVMRLLTDKELIKAWSGGDAEIENEVGGKFEMFDGWVSGEILKTGENELAYTWKTSEWGEDAAASEVHYKLTEENGATKVDLKHMGFPNEEEMNSHASGWTEHFFGPMENHILENNF
ncbi:MAG: SRPBCC domain-containing protein [Chitinophagales bacterium]|nr:SRPBCC domain-containing protein [Chitinophagaceae bacterium]MCB9064051.1 SRPBCC domain-containing protein [Chitinophagales bacterium]